jgi:hypothetical protein
LRNIKLLTGIGLLGLEALALSEREGAVAEKEKEKWKWKNGVSV